MKYCKILEELRVIINQPRRKYFSDFAQIISHKGRGGAEGAENKLDRYNIKKV